MKTTALTLICGLAMITAGFSQSWLVLKDNGKGREWVIRKGKTLTVSQLLHFTGGDEGSSTGTVVALTDTSLTLFLASGNYYKTIPLNDIDKAWVKQTSTGNGTAILIGGAGLASIVLAPLAGIDHHAPYNWTATLATLGMGALLSGTSYLILNAYEKDYRVSCVIHSRNERFRRHNNDTYYFSLATGFGPNYGGFGCRFQSRFGGIAGVGVHIGAGVDFQYLTDTTRKIRVPGSISVLGGVKFFPYRGWYLDVAFGNFGRLANVDVHENVVFVKNIYTPYGFVFSCGGDWIWGRTFGYNLGLGCALDLTAPESSNTFPTVEMGFIIKF